MVAPPGDVMVVTPVGSAGGPLGSSVAVTMDKSTSPVRVRRYILQGVISQDCLDSSTGNKIERKEKRKTS